MGDRQDKEDSTQAEKDRRQQSAPTHGPNSIAYAEAVPEKVKSENSEGEQ